MSTSTPVADAWYLHETEAHAYEVTVDPDRTRHLRSRPGITGKGFGTTMQMFAADRYRGKRVRFSATVCTTGVTGWSGLWMRVDGPARTRLAFDNMSGRPIVGTTSPARYEVVLDVAADAHAIALGILLHGTGEVTLSTPALEPVDPDVPATAAPSRPLPDDFRP